MASLLMRRVVINANRVLNYTPLPPAPAPAPAPANPFLTLRRISPFTSQCGGSNDSHSSSLQIDLSNEEAKRRLFNRLLYRSKQRGFLEVDLVLGKWVEDNIHSLDENQIRALVHVLDLEDRDLWKWISGQEQPPESINTNPVLTAVREVVMKSLDSHSAPETRATPGKEWAWLSLVDAAKHFDRVNYIELEMDFKNTKLFMWAIDMASNAFCHLWC